MATSFRDKAASRASHYRDTIAALQRDGDYLGAAHEARGWLMSELRKVARQRPADVPAVYREVTERIAALAEAIPTYKPAGTAKGGGNRGAA